MAKTAPSYDDEIDLIELIQVFLAHKTKFILLGVVGLALGLVFTFSMKPLFEVNFKIAFDHPIFDKEQLINSAGVQRLLNDSELNEGLHPHYSYNIKKKTFTTISETDEISSVVEDTFRKLAETYINNYLRAMEKFTLEGNNQSYIVDLNKYPNILLDKDNIANISAEDILKNFSISFSKIKPTYPKPLKHGVIGVFVGLVLAFLWLLAAILTRQLKST